MAVAPDVGWLQLFAAALGGGLTVKLVDIIYQEVRRRFDQTKTATKFVDEHLDPLLKAADEVVGKLHSLATEDFKTLVDRELNLNPVLDNDFGGLIYLFGRFWARIEIIRQEALSVAITKDKRGAMLQNFLACLELRRIRIVDRTSQRAIGELMVKGASDYRRTISYIEFIRTVETNEDARRWGRTAGCGFQTNSPHWRPSATLAVRSRGACLDRYAGPDTRGDERATVLSEQADRQNPEEPETPRVRGLSQVCPPEGKISIKEQAQERRRCEVTFGPLARTYVSCTALISSAHSSALQFRRRRTLSIFQVAHALRLAAGLTPAAFVLVRLSCGRRPRIMTIADWRPTFRARG